MFNKKDNKRPEKTISDGAIKATIWKRETQKGTFYATTFTKTYKDNKGEYQNSQNFSGTDLLKVAELAKQSYQASRDLYYEHRQEEHSKQQRNHEQERDYDQER